MSALDLSLGCILIGVLLNVWLFGFSVLQTYLYFDAFKSDRKALKAFVAVLFLADSLNSVFDAHFIYDYLVTNFGNMEFASRSNVTFTTDPVMTGAIAFMCQVFFAWRVHRLNKGWAVPAAICLFSFASLLGAIGSTVGVSIVHIFAKFQSFQVVVIIWLACAAVADLIITVSLIWTLRKSRTGFKTTDDLITRLIRTTLQTGLLTTTFAVIDLILFLASPTTLHLIFNLPLAKLYVNTLLSTLNARQQIQQVVFAGDHSHSGLRHVGSAAAAGTNRKSAFGTLSNTAAPGAGPSVHLATHDSRGMSILSRLGGRRPVRNDDGLENGIQIHTIEERFEEKSIAMGITESTSTFGASDLQKDVDDVAMHGQRNHSNSVATSHSANSSGQHTLAEPALSAVGHPFASPSLPGQLHLTTANGERLH